MELLGGTFDTSGMDAKTIGRLTKTLDTLTRYEGEIMLTRDLYTRVGTGKGIYNVKSRKTDKVTVTYKLYTSLDYDTYLVVPKLVHDAFIPNSGHVEPLDTTRVCFHA